MPKRVVLSGDETAAVAEHIFNVRALRQELEDESAKHLPSYDELQEAPELLYHSDQ
jgi:hypothetical protein